IYKSDIHFYFLAFNNASDAQTMLANPGVDTSLFKVAAHTDASGRVSTVLPAGYTYVLIWEAPKQNGVDNWYYTDSTTYTVVPFTPLFLGALSN
ncbi:MAG: hypothetical protein IVW57_06075, partial [Ktedonobacterales bacterium]|nr:hypothetical protein [Ktedonobacterales bacterium]